jgi:hypothetical protein
MGERRIGQRKLEGTALKTCEWFGAVLWVGRYLFMDSK